MTPQSSAGCIADAEFLDEVVVAQAPPNQILYCFRMAMQCELVKSGGAFQKVGIRSGRQFLPQMRQALLERQMQRELDEANQVATPPAAMAIKDVLAGVDVEGGMRFPVQGAQPHKLWLIPSATRPPVAPLQVLQQRNALFELLQIRIHGVECLSRSEYGPPA